MRTIKKVAIVILLIIIVLSSLIVLNLGRRGSDISAAGGAIGVGLICASAIIGSVILISSERKNT